MLMKLLARIVSKDKRVTIVGSAVVGQKALDSASTLEPDLVVTDLHMPGLDGAEVTRGLKQRPNPPVVFIVTSGETSEAQARCMQLADNSDRRFFNSVPTTLQLPSATVDRLEKLAKTELESNPQFSRLIVDVHSDLIKRE